MNVAKPLKLYTLEEFEQMAREDGWNYELIDGLVMMSPRPSLEHQSISGNIYFELRNILKGSNCNPIQEIDLVVDKNNLIPDLAVICNDELKGKRYEKAPIIVIEIASFSSISRDYVTKRNKYEQLGIQEYWVVSPDEKCIDVFDFAANKHMNYCSGKVQSSVLPEIEIDLDAIFA
ncbi:MAG: Uma2 family endonuclease [Peptococcaceae bacterium]|nr:Uma2 family endonuclease [Peptococcaceae bacterium]